ncbi:hypothetical protein EC973_003997 [Apophysomyces ossiformis]|uniref:L domain-like protein n=1 Tax=Apophysomyces ossiformis TaxID=679940 RepID=A0A8H7BXR1_9FUNG|nr:hypothetical protein EC973_003997 [Apophysomyces ossiformis]
MGQHTSKHHAPLTFGYVNRNESEEGLAEQTLEEDKTVTDFVLANPHLYKLEITCQNNCSASRRGTDSNGNKTDALPSVSENVVAATIIDEECKHCRQLKRLSLIRRDLEKDLAYIDETYYPDIKHYISQGVCAENGMIHPSTQTERTADEDENLDKLTVGDVAPRTQRPRRLTGPSMAVDLTGKSLVKLSPSIGYLDNLTKLNLSQNQMTSLPPEVGYLKNLRALNTSHNQLETIPDTIAFLSKLKILNLSHNNITYLPPSIGLLPKLQYMILNNNKLEEIPRELAQLRDLARLTLSHNPLKAIPAEIATLKSLKLMADHCEFVNEFTYDAQHDPPSLFEICARAAVRIELPIPSDLPHHIKDYLGRSQTCSFCGGPYFDSYVTRGRFIQRTARPTIALEYRLCAAHWNDNEDRIMAMFADLPANAIMKKTSDHPVVNTDGLDQPSRTINRSRGYSDSFQSLPGSPKLSASPSSSSLLSGRSDSTSSFSPARADSFSDSPDNMSPTIPIRSLKFHPSLPGLPVLRTSSSTANTTRRSSSPLAPPRLRQRASSSASVTRRIAEFLSPPKSNLSRSQSSMALHQQLVETELETRPSGSNRVNEVRQEQLETVDGHEQDSDQQWVNGVHPTASSSIMIDEPMNSTIPRDSAIRPAKAPVGGVFRAGLAHLESRLTRDRSGTV